MEAGLGSQATVDQDSRADTPLPPDEGGAGTIPPAGKFPTPDSETLTRQFPQLEILELLGQGGMGVVYKARQRRLNRLVALKILPPSIGEQPAFAERFRREAQALARLSHWNIVQVHDFGETDEFYYFIMEFVDGVNLRTLIRDGKLKPEEALAIVPQVCEALQFAHDEGIVHRDIKPENILIDKRGRVKIADFGLAKLLSHAPEDLSLTGTGQLMGTLGYMAPEQLQQAHAVDHRADIYSLGVVFYEMLTGELPLGRFAPPSQKVQVDVRLDNVVLRALEKEPERRYQHASDVKQEVETLRSSARPRAGQNNLALRERRTALTQALNAHDKAAVKSFVDTAWVAKDKKGRIVATYWQLLDQLSVLFYDHRKYHQSLEIESIDQEADVARIVTRRVESVTVLWLFPVNNVTRWIETWKLVNDSWLCIEERVLGDNDPPPLFNADSDQLERLVLPFLPENKTAAIKAFRDKTGARLGEARKAVEAIARKHGVPLPPSSSRDWTSIGGMILCVLGIAALFIPSAKVHLYDIIEPGHTTGNQRWTSFLETGQFGWGWSTNMGTFLTLGLYLLGTYAVPRLAFQRAVAIITAGIVLLVLGAVSAQSAGVLQLGHIYYTLYVGFYVVCALAVGLLVLGVMALRLALLNTSPDADAQSVKGVRRKLHSLWKSALSLWIGSRIKGPSAALLSGGMLEGEEAVGSDARLPGKTPESDPAGGSPIIVGEPTNTTAPVPPRERTPKAAGFTRRVAKAFLLIVHVCCLILFLSFSGSGSAKGHRIQVGFPSPWFEAEGSPTSFNHHFNLASWSWAIAALGALSCYLFGAIRRRETAKLSALEKVGANGCLLWFLIVTLAFIVASVMGFLMMAQEWSTAQKDAVGTFVSSNRKPA
jgi:serine/threonine protein kinase